MKLRRVPRPPAAPWLRCVRVLRHRPRGAVNAKSCERGAGTFVLVVVIEHGPLCLRRPHLPVPWSRHGRAGLRGHRRRPPPSPLPGLLPALRRCCSGKARSRLPGNSVAAAWSGRCSLPPLGRNRPTGSRRGRRATQVCSWVKFDESLPCALPTHVTCASSGA